MQVRRIAVLVIMLLSGTALSVQQRSGFDELPRNRPITRELAKGERHVYRVGLQTGQFLRVLVEPPEAMIEAMLIAPDGRLVSMYHHDLRPESLATLADVAGQYEIAVSLSSEAGGPGVYRLRLGEIRAGEPQDEHQRLAERAVAAGVRFSQQGTPQAIATATGRLEEALPQWQAAGDRRNEARTSNLLSEIRADDSNASLDLARRALVLFQEAGVRRGEADASNNIGAALLRLEEYEQAALYLQRSIEIYREIGYSPGVATSSSNLGAVQESLSDPQAAIDAYVPALQLFRQLGNRVREAGTLNALGVVYNDLGQHQAAVDSFLAALAARREMGQRRDEEFILHNLGVLDVGLGRNAEALSWFEDALSGWRRVGNRTGEAATLMWRAKVLHATGDRRQALEDANAAFALFRTLKSQTGQAASLLIMARLTNESGDLMTARRHASAALDVFRAIASRRGEAFALIELGIATTAAGEWDVAAEHFRAALSIQEDTADVDGRVVATLALAQLERARGRLQVAREHAETTLALIESQRARVASSELRASLLAARHEAYGFTIDLLMQLHAEEPDSGYSARALETSERARARSLLDLLMEVGTDIREGVDTELVDQERRLRQRLSVVDSKRQRLEGTGNVATVTLANREIRELRLQLRELGGRIRTLSPRYAELIEPRPISLSVLQREVLDDDTTLLEYALGERRSFLWAVTTRTITSYVLPARAEIERAARRAHGLLTVSQQRQRRREAERAVDELARMLLGPARNSLRTKRLAIVADGALQFVPFAVLPFEGRPLILGAEIVHLPSASTLALLRQELSGRARAPKSLAIFADPVLSADDPRVSSRAARSAAASVAKKAVPAAASATTPAAPMSDVTRSSLDSGISRFERLVFTRREAEAIQALARSTDAFVALDFQASRDVAVRTDLQPYRIIHFATHGLLNSVHPDLSGLVLSLVDGEGRPQDGFLRSHDIFNLKLGADLVVLSACRTALGEEIRGEGLISLVRGFMYAGSPRVIASLWDVRDAATADLMRQLYTGMLRDGLSPAAALRAAQVWMSQHPRWNAPYYWAGFVLQGEWR